MQRTIRIAFLGFVSFYLAGCAKGPLTAADLRPDIDPSVELEVVGDPPTLRFSQKNDSKCAFAPNSQGCLDTPVNTRAQANFSITSGNYSFACFEVCVGDDKNGRKCDLNPFERLEFGALVQGSKEIASPGQDGKVNLRKVFGGNVSSFVVANQNSLVEDYYYRVQACRNVPAADELVCRDTAQVAASARSEQASPSSPVCIWNEDPPWRNQGRHRQ